MVLSTFRITKRGLRTVDDRRRRRCSQVMPAEEGISIPRAIYRAYGMERFGLDEVASDRLVTLAFNEDVAPAMVSVSHSREIFRRMDRLASEVGADET